eukprot:11165586-Lingulodinium_polyedra.AAC.1
MNATVSAANNSSNTCCMAAAPLALGPTGQRAFHVQHLCGRPRVAAQPQPVTGQQWRRARTAARWHPRTTQ